MERLERILEYHARSLECRGADREDLMQEGRIAAWRAGQKFDPAKGNKDLLSYQTTMARYAMMEYIRRKAPMICIGSQRGEDRVKAGIQTVTYEDMPVPERAFYTHCRDFAPSLIAAIDYQRMRTRYWGCKTARADYREPHDGNLTLRQVRVLLYVLVDGLEYDAVAAMLGTTASTVTMDIQKAYEVLKIPRTQRQHAGLVHLYIKAIRRGLLEPIVADGGEHGLYPVELETVRAIVGRYMSQARTASYLGRSVNTINDTVGRVRKRWGVKNALEMYKQAVRRGVIEPPAGPGRSPSNVKVRNCQHPLT